MKIDEKQKSSKNDIGFETKSPEPKEARAFGVGGVGDLSEYKDSVVLKDPRGGIGRGGILDLATERLWDNCNYPRVLSFRNYYNMYARNNVAARVIETFPNYTWNVIPTVQDKNGPNSHFSKAAKEILKSGVRWKDGVKLDLIALMKQLDVLGGIGGESLMVFGFNDGGKLDREVKPSKKNKIEWVKVLHNGQFTVDKVNKNQNSDTYGDIITYKSKSFASSNEINFVDHIEEGIVIHQSRCVHFRESSGLPYGTSRIQKCYNQLLDIVKVSGASAEVYWLGAFSGLAVSTDPDARLSDESYKRMKEEVVKYFSGLARSLLFEGANAKLLYPAIVSPEAHFDLQISMISISSEIPRRFLTGAEAAKLASQQDSINWMDRVSNRRISFISPCVISPVIQLCVNAGVLPKPVGGEIEVIWPKTQSLSLDDRAKGANLMTEAMVKFFTSGLSKAMKFETYLVEICGFGEDEAKIIARSTNVKKFKLPESQPKTVESTKKSKDGDDDDDNDDDSGNDDGDK